MTALRDHHYFGALLDDKKTRLAALKELNCSRFLFVEVLTREPDPDDKQYLANVTKESFTMKYIDPKDPVLGPCAQPDEEAQAFLRTELYRDAGDMQKINLHARTWRLSN